MRRLLAVFAAPGGLGCSGPPAPPPPAPAAAPPVASSATPVPAPPTPSATAPLAVAAPPPNPCPDDMVYVDTVHCPDTKSYRVGLTCTDVEKKGNANNLKICNEFAPGQRCSVPKRRQRFCIDRYEYPSKKGAHPPVKGRSLRRGEGRRHRHEPPHGRSGSRPRPRRQADVASTRYGEGMRHRFALGWVLMGCLLACSGTAPSTSTSVAVPAPSLRGSTPPMQEAWEVDFRDDFAAFDEASWQDQILWVNEEDQCYLRDGEAGTREVSGGTLKLRVVDLGEPRSCDNVDKHGKVHPDTRYGAGRIASKNRREFFRGRWTARLRVRDSGQPGMFPAFWLLGANNDEPPVEEPDETVCWPLSGSGEIDVFEHHSDGGPDHYAARAIVSLGECDAGDWQSQMAVMEASLASFHEYGVEWQGEDLVFRLDGEEVHRAVGQGAKLVEPLFAILNFAKIKPGPMAGPWTMEVDWVQHERRVR